MSHPKSDVGAVVLATTISAVAPAPMILEAELRVKPVRRVIQMVEPPLDLDGEVFRYRIDAQQRIRPVRDENSPPAAPQLTVVTPNGGSSSSVNPRQHRADSKRASNRRGWSSGPARRRRPS